MCRLKENLNTSVAHIYLSILYIHQFLQLFNPISQVIIRHQLQKHYFAVLRAQNLKVGAYHNKYTKSKTGTIWGGEWQECATGKVWGCKMLAAIGTSGLDL